METSSPRRIDRWLDASKFAEAMSIHPKTLRVVERSDPRFPKGFYVGRRRFWTESEVAEYLTCLSSQARREPPPTFRAISPTTTPESPLCPQSPRDDSAGTDAGTATRC